ncbi:MAG: threonine-phosphate decarboxylase CobD [Gammaproteobacteria bacterium]
MNNPEPAGDRPPHGGRLREAERRYGIPLAAWLDLSTGINPSAYPMSALPVSAWTRLPEDDDGLIDAARAYYGAPHVLPVAGSQAAIQALPALRTPCSVGIITPGYAEHARAWRRAGHAVVGVPVEALANAARQVEVLVVIHPNNPTGARFAPETLLDWHVRLAAREGWLVVDEAFMDATPADSLARYSARPGLIVLRSLGKFFGLAGARVGFVLGAAALLQRLAEALGPWPLAGPSRAVASHALADTAWHSAARRELPEVSARLAKLLTAHGLVPTGGCGLFQWVVTREAQAIHEALAREGILTRLFHHPPSLRFGLPGTEHGWMRLEAALARQGITSR